MPRPFRAAIWWGLICSLWLAPGSVVLASTISPLPDTPGYVHEVFTTEDGLPSASIVQALQSRDGYLWLATFDGLVRFDGARFDVFDTERAPALGSNRIVQLLEARGGALWIRTEAGHVVRYASGVFTGCTLPERGQPGSCAEARAGASHFTVLAEDPDGTIWLGGRSGLFRVAGNAVERVPGLELETGVQAFLRDRTGRLWVGTSAGIWAGEPGRFVRLRIPPDLLGGAVTGLAEDAAGDIWVSTHLGVGRIRGGSLRLELEGTGFLQKDPAGTLWIVAGERLLRFRQGRFEPVASAEEEFLPYLGPGQNTATGPGGALWLAWARSVLLNGRPAVRLPPSPGAFVSITLDREGSLWFPLSFPYELHALHPTRLTTLVEGLANPAVYPVYEDRDGSIWAGGPGSLAVLSPGASVFRSLPVLENPRYLVQAFLRDRSGTLWVGLAHGLYSLGPAGLERPEGSQAPEASVRAIHEDARGALWIGSQTGLFRRDPAGVWTRFGEENGLPHPWIRVIRETADGALWLGTHGGGVIRYAGGKFRAITTAQGLASDLVRGIYLAPDGRLWIAAETGGLSRLDPATLDRPEGPAIAVVGERQGLFSNAVHQIVADDFGHLWMSSNQGIFRARWVDLNAVADGGRDRLETVAYTERDGMLNREANGGIHDAGFRDSRGRIWFPTQGGVVRIDPRRALEPSPPPQALVQSLRVGDDEIPLSAPANTPVRLLPNQRSFALELSAPSFRAPERQRFRFRLRPYDRDWVDAGTRRTAFYTKVPPGRYVFEVVASGPDGGWSERPAAVPLEVVPRFYETLWFLLLCALATVAAMVALARLWAARQRARQRQLERLVEERTSTIAEQADRLRELDRLKSQLFANVSHELRTPLTLILGPLADAREGRFGPVGDELGRQLALAGRNAQRLLMLVDQLLDISRLDAGRLRLRVRSGDLAAFVRQRVEAFLPLAERREIDLSLEVSSEPVAVWMDEAQLEKALDNLLGNALKFTPRGGRVQVTLLTPAGSESVRIAVRDNGPGIPADQLARVFDRFYQGDSTHRWPGAGIGLALARQLIELHGGTIAAESTPGEGACFTLTLRRGRDHFPPELLEEGPPPSRIPASGSFLPAPDLFRDPAALDSDAFEAILDPGEDRTTVLVVDDHAEIRAYVRRHLEPDYRVIEAADGLQGLAAARQLVPDLVVSDVMMPGLDGNALFRSLREDPELELIPVVLLTAKASKESRIQGLRDGVDDYLVKPFDPRELKARVDNLIARRKRLQERLRSAPESLPPLPPLPTLPSTQPPRPLQVSEIEVQPADEALLARVQSIIEERLGDPELTVEALADQIGCDRSYLLRKLRTLTGETPSGLIRSLRLQRAEQLLRAGAGSVSEIAYAVGFKSVAHFSNAFHERTGERPSAFAARHRG